MLVDDSEVTLEDEDWAEPAPARIDWRVCNEARRRELADKLALSLVERIEPSVTLEVGTVATAMAEIRERIPVPESTVLLEPAVAAALARDGLAPEAPSEEDEAWLARVMSCEQLHVIVHSEAPEHYTYLRVTKRGESIENVVFKDSLRDPPATAARQVEKLLDARKGKPEVEPTTKGTKGCRACMGKWFEEIRLRTRTKSLIAEESPEIED